MIEQFDDGNMSDVFRIGDVVRKQRGVWWNATRQVLNHLQAHGYQYAPQIVSEQWDTVDLTYIAGVTIPSGLEGYEDARLLTELGTRVREMHDTLASFQPDPGTEFVPWPIQPEQQEIVCHNDTSPWNTVVMDDALQGFIDWDLVSLATREWELAWMCWRWAPIYPTGNRTRFTAEEQADRCRVLLESYGLDALDLRDFANVIDLRMQCGVESVEVLGAQGVAGFDRILATGMHLSAHEDRAWFLDHADVFRSAFR